MSFLLIGIFLIFAIAFFIFWISKKKSGKFNSYSHDKLNLRKETAPQLDAMPELQEIASEAKIEFADEEDTSEESLAEKETSSANTANSSEPKIVVLHLMSAKNQAYYGYELLQTLLSYGLRYGKRNIFHRYEQKTGRGDVMFSLASAIKPGTFDLQKMGNFSCPGLVLFMTMDDAKDPMKAFELMLETADHLVEDLGGNVLDEHRQAFTTEKMMQIRKNIRRFIEKKSTPDLFDQQITR
jgi:cell division protein ZipA